MASWEANRFTKGIARIKKTVLLRTCLFFFVQECFAHIHVNPCAVLESEQISPRCSVGVLRMSQALRKVHYELG